MAQCRLAFSKAGGRGRRTTRRTEVQSRGRARGRRPRLEGPLFWGAQEAVGATDMGPREGEGAGAVSISQGVEPTIILTEEFKSQFLYTRPRREGAVAASKSYPKFSG